MRILLWHGALLGGTGSNVYTRQLFGLPTHQRPGLSGGDGTLGSDDLSLC